MTIPHQAHDWIHEAAEGLVDPRAYDSAKAALATGEDELVPAEFAKRLTADEEAALG